MSEENKRFIQFYKELTYLLELKKLELKCWLEFKKLDQKKEKETKDE